MREAIGGIFMIKLMMIFLVLFTGLLSVAYQYAKAFKAKNVIIDYIEKYEGYNDLAIENIDRYLEQSSIHYDVPIENENGHYASNHPDAYCSPKGYCIQMINYDTESFTVTNDDTTESFSDVSSDSRRIGCKVTTFIPINLFGIGDIFSVYKFNMPSLEVTSDVQVYDPHWHNIDF